MSKKMNKQINSDIRAFMVEHISQNGPMKSKDLVEATKQEFPAASAKQVAGNLSALCCAFHDLQYSSGIVDKQS